MKLFAQLALLIILTSISALCFAEQESKPKVDYPETEIFLFEIDLSLKENVLADGRNVTNRVGYDNQPYFTKGSDSFVYSRDDGYQTDVYEYFLSSGKSLRLTNSAATEFSPTPFPDNKSISFVSDRSSSIWHGTRDDIDNPKLAQANSNSEPIGYYAWNHQTGDILYWSQYGFSVKLVHESSQAYHFISGHAMPSTPHVIPDTDKFSFVHRQTNSQDWIKEFDPKTKAIRPLTPVVGANHNYVWTADGSILMIESDRLYRWVADLEKGWLEVADLTEFGIVSANRLAISPNGKKLAVVGLPADGS